MVTGKKAAAIFMAIGAALVVINWRAIRRDSDALGEAAKTFVEVNSESVSEDNEGKLVVFSGALTGEAVTDSDLNVSANGFKLKRIVETYQWVEDCDSSDSGEKACTHDKEWREGIVDSSSFEETSFSNPKTLRYESANFYARNAKIGAFALPSKLLEKYVGYKDLEFDDTLAFTDNDFSVQGGYLTNAADISKPYVGDVRIKYQYAEYGDATVMAKQVDSTVAPYDTKDGEIFYIKSGKMNGEEMIATVKKGSNSFRWVVLAIGAALFLFATFALFKSKK